MASLPDARRGRPLPSLWYAAPVRRGRAIVTYLVPFVVLVGVWQTLAWSGRFTINQLPPPSLVAEALIDSAADGTLFGHIVQSLGRLALGMLAGSAMGIALGVAMGLHRPTAELLEPLASFLNALSGIAWIPLAIVWFGLGPAAVTFILWNSIFFLVLFNTLLGVSTIPPIYRSAVLTLGGGRWHVVKDVILPGALPNILLGVRMGFAFGWRALVAAEMIGATGGLGFMIYNASYYLRSDIILAGIIVIGVLVQVIERLILVPLERSTIERWGLVRPVE